MAEVAVTVGCSQALYAALQCLVREGDEVVLLEPFFDLYLGQVRLAGGQPRFVPLLARSDRSGWDVDFDALGKSLLSPFDT